MTATEEDWSAEAVSPLDDRVFRIDSKGIISGGN